MTLWAVTIQKSIKTRFYSKIIKTEEERFHETINDGLQIITDLIASLKAEGKDTLLGKDIFKLYDTYGFLLN